MCPLHCVRVHASSFSAVAKKKLLDVDCPTRSSCGVIMLPAECPASAAVVAATSRRSAVARSLCRLRQSALTCPFFLQWKHCFSVAVGLLATTFALDGCLVSAYGDSGGGGGVALAFPSSSPFPFPLGMAPSCIGAWLRTRDLQDFVSRPDPAVQPCGVAYEMPKMTTPLRSSPTVSATGPRSHAQ